MGQKFVAYDTTGSITAYYDDVDSPPPVSAVILPITLEEWQNSIDSPGKYSVVNGVLQAAVVWPIPKTLLDLKSEYETAVQNWLDQGAQSHGYDSGVSCASYAASTNPTYASDAKSFIAWRDAVWTQCYSDWQAIQAGTMNLPSDTQSFITTLPQPTTFNW